MAQTEGTERKNDEAVQIKYSIQVENKGMKDLVLYTNDTDTAMKVVAWYKDSVGQKAVTDKPAKFMKNIVVLSNARSDKGIGYNYYTAVLSDKLSEFGYKAAFSHATNGFECLLFQQQ